MQIQREDVDEYPCWFTLYAVKTSMTVGWHMVNSTAEGQNKTDEPDWKTTIAKKLTEATCLSMESYERAAHGVGLNCVKLLQVYQIQAR